MFDARLHRVQHRLTAFVRGDFELDHAGFGSLASGGQNIARPCGEIAGHRPEVRIREQEHRAGAAPAVGAQAQRRGHLGDAAQAQVVRQVVDLGAHHRADLAFQRIARQ